jgi:hypothetical protein
MGGQAFAHLSPPLPTPRIPPEIYTQVLTTTHTLLQHHFEVVRSALEAPEKETYGDIDILVFEPKPNSPLNGVTFSPQVATLLGNIIGTKHCILEKGGHTMNFAIPWPQSPNSRERIEARFVQIDIKICPTLKMLEWELFHGAHGDLWNILGSTIRKFGLTVNNLGMHLRIPEIELKDRKKSMILLTDEPNTILNFLGLDEEKWWKEFGSREEMFEYAAGCRMFWVKDLEEEDEDEESGKGREEIEGQEGGVEGKKKLKHNDRQRMAKRPIFREWMDEFIPKCRAEGRFTDSSNGNVTREQIRDEAFAHFDPTIKTTYETRLREWKLATHTDELWRLDLKGSVPEDIDPQFRAASIRTLKAVIMEGETFEGKEVPEVARNEEVSDSDTFNQSGRLLTTDFLQGFWDADKVRAWVKENWQKAGEIGWTRQQERAVEGMRVKAEKKRLQEEEAARKRAKVDSNLAT